MWLVHSLSRIAIYPKIIPHDHFGVETEAKSNSLELFYFNQNFNLSFLVSGYFSHRVCVVYFAQRVFVLCLYS